MLYQEKALKRLCNNALSQEAESIRQLELIKFICSANDDIFEKYFLSDSLDQNDIYLIMHALFEMGNYFTLADFIEYNERNLIESFKDAYPVDFAKNHEDKFIARLEKLKNQ